jgi:hypothetical protein
VTTTSGSVMAGAPVQARRHEHPDSGRPHRSVPAATRRDAVVLG